MKKNIRTLGVIDDHNDSGSFREWG